MVFIKKGSPWVDHFMSNEMTKIGDYFKNFFLMKLSLVRWWIVLQLMRIHGECKQVLDIKKNNVTHTTKKTFTATFKNSLGGGHVKKPPRLMPAINRGGHFLLTKAVTKNYLGK